MLHLYVQTRCKINKQVLKILGKISSETCLKMHYFRSKALGALPSDPRLVTMTKECVRLYSH